MEKKFFYESPEVEMVSVEVEKGFATSGSKSGFGTDDFTVTPEEW